LAFGYEAINFGRTKLLSTAPMIDLPYRDFLARHRDKLQSIDPMRFILANLDKIPPTELATIGQKAAEWHLGSH